MTVAAGDPAGGDPGFLPVQTTSRCFGALRPDGYVAAAPASAPATKAGFRRPGAAITCSHAPRTTGPRASHAARGPRQYRLRPRSDPQGPPLRAAVQAIPASPVCVQELGGLP